MDTEQPPVFNLRPPEGKALPLVVSIPHTGTYLPPSILENFASDAVRALPMTDWHLHHLYDFLPALGITTLYANYSRLVIDLNRPPDAAPLYPGRFETGLVPMQTFAGEPIYQDPLTETEIEARRVQFHAPYHERLGQLLADMRARFGRVVLLDAHSVASGGNLLHPPLREDIYLGDRDGQSAAPWLMDGFAEAFARAGYKVSRNNPYKGGYITAHYGQQEGVDALQIEMCQRLYMNENDPAVAVGMPEFVDMQRVLYEVLAEQVQRLSIDT